MEEEKITTFENKIEIQHLQALLEGKQLKFIYPNAQMQFIFTPERHGVFMTYDKLAELRRKIGWEFATDSEKVFRELLGDQVFEEMVLPKMNK